MGIARDGTVFAGLAIDGRNVGVCVGGQVVHRYTPPSSPTLDLSTLGAPTLTFAPGTTNISQFANTSTSVHPSQSAVMRAAVSFPNTAHTGCIYEGGGSGVGTFLGTLAARDSLVFRAGHGGSDNDTPNEGKASMEVPYAQVAGQTGELVWEMSLPGGKIRTRLWFRGVLLGDVTSTGAQTKHSGGNGGGYGIGYSSICAGCTTDAVPAGMLMSDMDYWKQKTVPPQ